MTDMARAAIDVRLLCGFLGSGKTTRINHLIAEGTLRDALFLVNDFGRLNIDAELITAEEDGIVRLNNGCACCGLSGDLSAQLSDIRRWPSPPTLLVFEASGVARPRPLMQLFGAAEGYSLGSAETLVDLSALQRLLHDPAIADITQAQITDVPRLRINRHAKLPGIVRERETALLKSLNSAAELVWDSPPKELSITYTKSSESAVWPDFHALAASAGVITSRTLALPRALDSQQLMALLDAAAPILLRAKGMLRDCEHPQTLLALQWTPGGGRRTPFPGAKQDVLVLIGKEGPGMDALVSSIEALL
ncbi:CobW family GTP-binding protein [Salinicola salarius]|uniref:CobW family GTP-binding protein n=1 Tax=Salinicola salarius TaxID=430457 RepID=UPI0015C67A71|nr:GTP-binding protein [Salinicola salarius]